MFLSLAREVFFSGFAPEFIHRIDHRVDLAGQGFLRFRKRGDNLAKRDRADHRKIYVAPVFHVVAGERAEEESELDLILKSCQRPAQNIRHAAGFDQQRFEFAEYRTIPVGLVKT